MTRRLLALVALLSGLAALHAPAHASRLDQLSYDVQTLTQTASTQGGASCQCAYPPKKAERLCLEQKALITRPRMLGILPLSVVPGVDRALE